MAQQKSKYELALEFAKKRKEWRTDPIGFFKDVLGMTIPNHQRKLIEACSKRNRISIKSANGLGKSHCVAALAYHFFFTRVTDDPNDTCMVLITAPTFAQIKASIFANIRMFAETAEKYVKKQFGEEFRFLERDFSESANVCEYWFNSKCFISGVATGEGRDGAGNSLSGRHATHVMCISDESQMVSEGTFSALEGILAGGVETKYILLGNTTLPNGASGTYYDSFQSNSTFSTLTITAFDSPNFVEPDIKPQDMLLPDHDPSNWRNKLDKCYGTNYKEAKRTDNVDAWENEVKRKMPLAVITNPISVYRILERCGFNTEQYEYKTRVMAEFPNGGDNCVISQQQLDDSMDNYSLPEKHQSGIRSMGVDVSAGLGRDFSTIAVRDGNKIIFIEEYQLNAPDLEEKIIEVYENFGCEYCCIERDGVGKPIFDHLLYSERIYVIPINSGGGPGIVEPLSYDEENETKILKETYNRKRDELWFNLRNLLNPYVTQYPILLPRHNKLKKHLMCASWKKGNTGKIQVSPKDDMRKKIKESPDMADAVIFAFAPLGEADMSMNYDLDLMTFKNVSWT